jgi:hypothetical protein
MVDERHRAVGVRLGTPPEAFRDELHIARSRARPSASGRRPGGFGVGGPRAGAPGPPSAGASGCRRRVRASRRSASGRRDPRGTSAGPPPRAPELGQAPAERTRDLPDLVGRGAVRRRWASGRGRRSLAAVGSGRGVGGPGRREPGRGPQSPFGARRRLTWIVRRTSSWRLAELAQTPGRSTARARAGAGPDHDQGDDQDDQELLRPMFSISLLRSDGAPDGAPGRRSVGGRPP